MGSKIVTASVTPNGYADAALPLSDEPLKDVDEYQFVMPHEESMSVNEFLNILEASPKTGILQNLLFNKLLSKKSLQIRLIVLNSFIVDQLRIIATTVFLVIRMYIMFKSKTQISLMNGRIFWMILKRFHGQLKHLGNRLTL